MLSEVDKGLAGIADGVLTTPWTIILVFRAAMILEMFVKQKVRVYGWASSTRPSGHRYGERHRRNSSPKRLTRRRDGDDAHDADIRAYSRQGMRLYFVGSLTPST